MRIFLVLALVQTCTLGLWTHSASAQIFSRLHTFSTATGFDAPLTQGPDGTLYGTSSGGGLSGNGTIFKMQPDGTGFAILYSFANGIDGAGPTAGLVLSGNTLYGTARNGGSGGNGTVFKINTDGTGFVPLHVFTNADGAMPQTRLVLADGVLYGTTYQGGSHNAGTIFKLSTEGTGFTNLFSFGGVTASSGAYPLGGLALSGSMLFGTAKQGGTNFNGVIFAINTNGTGFTVLHTFAASSIGTNSDGYFPVADLVVSGNALYGTAMNGSPAGQGTMFRLATDGGGFTNLHNFTNGADGATPVAGLVLSGNTLYGATTKGGGASGSGTIFRINTDGSGFTTITNFAGARSSEGAPGAGTSSLLLSGDTLFGAGGGVVFGIRTNGANGAVLSNGSEGAKPLGGLALSGSLYYGTTSAGGTPNSGIIYAVATNGLGFNTVYTFSTALFDSSVGGFTNADGATPRGTLIPVNGKLFGVANSGGTFGAGSIFSINTNGTGFTNLHSFTNILDGRGPMDGLVQGGSTLYGTTRSGGISNSGTIFKINTDGSSYQTVYSFTNFDDPQSGLLLSGDTLYGTTYFGGTNGDGSVFKINTNGTGFTVLYSFKAATTQNDTTNVNGANPSGRLFLSGNTLYGTAAYGGIGENSKGDTKGTVFKINTDGSGFALLHAFFGNFEGAKPMAGLVLSGNTLFGTTTAGGNGSGGTVFQLDTSGNNFATIHSFALSGGTPMGDLIVANGAVYGTTEFSDNGSGCVFSVTPTAAPMIQFTASPTNGFPPATVQFSAPTVDDKGNPILQRLWNFGDGSTSTAQNPSHTYSNDTTYFPSLIATNNNGTMVAGSGPSIVVAYPTSILNGGFETGTFTNWTRTGAGGSSISTASQYKHSGTYGGQLLASGGLGYLSQTIRTTPGASYRVSFWLAVPFSLTPNEFRVTWGGNVLMDQTNLPTLGWTNIQFLVTATNTSTVLQFGYLSGLFGFDDVSVVSIKPIISGFGFSGNNLVLTNTGGLSDGTYLVLTSTNLAQPLDQWVPIATNVPGADGNFSITATNARNPNARQQFYILQMR